MSNHAKIVAVLTAKPGKVEELRALLDGMIAASQGEAGNMRYDLWRDQANAERFVLDELYVDHAAIAAHRETAQFGTYLARINDLAERTAFVLDPIAMQCRPPTLSADATLAARTDVGAP